MKIRRAIENALPYVATFAVTILAIVYPRSMETPRERSERELRAAEEQRQRAERGRYAR